jgi:hypothetical protein
VTRGWFLRGSRPVVEFNWTRKRFHAYGVINGEKEHYRFYDEINWRTVMDFLRLTPSLKHLQYRFYKPSNFEFALQYL